MRPLFLITICCLFSCMPKQHTLHVYESSFSLDAIDFASPTKTNITSKVDTIMAIDDIDALKKFVIRYKAIKQTNEMLSDKGNIELKIYSASITDKNGISIIDRLEKERLDSLSKNLFGLSGTVDELIKLTKK